MRTRSSPRMSSRRPSTSTRPCCITVIGVGDVHHDVHVVLDQHHGVLVAQAADQLLHVVEVVDAHARGRLVEKDRLGPRGQRHADFEPALLAVRQLAGRRVARSAASPRRSSTVGDRLGVGARAARRRPAVRAPARGVDALRRERAGSRARDRFANRLVTWNERAMPRCTRRWSGSCVTSWPSNTMLPAGDRPVPVSTWKSVVLPAPFGPITECTVLRRDPQVDAGERGELAVALGDADRFDQDGVAHACSLRGCRRLPACSARPCGARVARASRPVPTGRAACTGSRRSARGRAAAASAATASRASRPTARRTPRPAPRRTGCRVPPITVITRIISLVWYSMFDERRDAGHHRVQRAREAGDRARDHEGQQLEALEVVADRRGALLVVADREQRAAEDRMRRRAAAARTRPGTAPRRSA